MKGTKTGGRKKGTPNKATVANAAAVAASGLTPLEFLTRNYRDESLDMALRQDAAKAAAPYVHAKRATVELTGEVKTKDVTFTSDRDFARRVAFFLAKGLQAKAA